MRLATTAGGNEVLGRCVCVHGHFYQPPRENPWLEAVEVQDSAFPYDDWNARVTAECYRPNQAARILDDQGRIAAIVNNYARMSFNFGPTLLAWLERHDADCYQGIIEADRQSQDRFGGHGSALAQPYNHMILPLANRRDKFTQVRWGVRDFQHRFGRHPEGMWLPETAVDVETLEVLAEARIGFTILAPHQAARVRVLGADEWTDVSGSRIDTRMPYRAILPSGRSIVVFFYDGAVSCAVGFGGLLKDGGDFARRLEAAFVEGREGPQLVHVANDGETFGHHHPRGDMALAYALDRLERDGVRLVNYAQFLEMCPPTHEVQIAENTSWSCSHGIERWRRDCGCRCGQQPGWTQDWRAFLRTALDELRDRLAPACEHLGNQLLRDLWRARNEYIDVILNRSPAMVAEFLSRHERCSLTEEERITVLRLMELQRNAQLMYTSCGWYFDDVSGIETVQVLHYTGRVVRLAQELFGGRLEERLLAELELAKSNIAEHGDGRRIYENWVRPAQIGLVNVGAHHAATVALQGRPDPVSVVYCYDVTQEDLQVARHGRAVLALGRHKVSSRVTGESARQSFAVLRLGDHDIRGGVRDCTVGADDERTMQAISEAFAGDDLEATLRLLAAHFNQSVFSLDSLLRDQQRRMAKAMLAITRSELEAAYGDFFSRQAALVRHLNRLRVPSPRPFRAAAEVVTDSKLRQAAAQLPPDGTAIASLLAEASAEGLSVDYAGLGEVLSQTIEKIARRLRASPGNTGLLETLDAAVRIARSLPVEVDVWEAQNAFWRSGRTLYPELAREAGAGNDGAAARLACFRSLGDRLGVALPSAGGDAPV